MIRIKNYTKILLTSAALYCSITSLVSLEMRTPLLSDRGPMRYLFDFDEPKTTYDIKTWSVGNFRYADKAYAETSGTKTTELTRLIFNKSDFKITEAFPECQVPHNSEFYNPLLRTVRINNKTQYLEQTVILGGQISRLVYQDKGRIGLRASLPLRTVTIDRRDQNGIPRGASLEDVVIYSFAPRSNTTSSLPRLVPLMRLDFAEALKQSSEGLPAINYSNEVGAPMAGGQVISDPLVDPTKSENSIKRCLGVVRSPRGVLPRTPEIPANVIVLEAETTANPDGNVGTTEVLPADGNAEYNTLYRFDTTGSRAGQYKRLDERLASDVNTRLAVQETKEELWLVPYVKKDGDTSSFTEGGSLKVLNDLSKQVTENGYEWLKDRGYVLEDDSHSGIGDLQVDLFYEQALTDQCYTELLLGFKVPTAKETKEVKGPYKAMLGNGKHWEVKLGALLAFKPLAHINLNVDGYYAFVLPKEEDQFAAFKGSLIKNVGPLVKATTNWNYFVGRANITIFHLKSKAISNMIGYEFYYKDKDFIVFPRNTAETWLGRKFDIDRQAIRNEYVLDESVSTQNTDAVAHRIKLETSMRITDQCEFFFGFGYTFAGKNVPREIDGNIGLHVYF